MGGSNQTLLLATSSSADLDNGSLTLPGLILTPSVYFFKYGYSEVYRSTNGGHSWSPTWIPANASWTGNNTLHAGTVGLGVVQLAAGGTGGATGAKVFGIEQFGEACLVDLEVAVLANGGSNCTSTLGIYGAMGVAVTESTNGGQSWSTARPLTYSSPLHPILFPSGGGQCDGLLHALNGNITSDAQISYSSGSNVVVATWVNDSYSYFNLSCVSQVVMGNYLDYTSSWMSISTNGGASWSTPTAVSKPFGLNPNNLFLPKLFAYTSTAIGPGPSYPIYRVWVDTANLTGSTLPFEFTSSTNNGTSWSTPGDLSLNVNPVFYASPGIFLNWTSPTLLVDNWTGSSYRGDLYLIWNDNTTGGGFPSIAFSRSSDSGATWSTPVYISANTPSSLHYFQPSASVAPNGQIWVDYYGESMATSNNGAGLLTGTYNVYGTYSGDGGTTWAPQFQLTDTSSTFIASGGPGTMLTIGWTPFFFGGASDANPPAQSASYGSPAIVGTTNGAYASWEDCRGVSCPGVAVFPTPSAYVTNLHPAALTSNAPAVNETVNVFGSATTYALPASGVFETGATIGVSVPPWVPDNLTSIYAFQNYSGFASSNSNPASLVYSGSGALSANYKPEPAGWIAGTVGPYAPGLVVTVNGASVPLTPFNTTADQFNATIAAGFSYIVTALRAGYTPYSQSVPTQAGKVSPQNIWLPRESGWISGKLTPANATLMVNSTLVAVNPNGGAFNQTVTWGDYWVNASESGYTTFSQLVVVSPEKTSPINPTLVGGWITGSINPLSGAVQINGAPVTLQAGNFNVSEPGGTYTLTARAPGYSWFHWTVAVTPGHAVSKNIRLTNQGYIVGTVGPANAVASAIVLVAGSQVRLNASGGFNASEGPGSHTVSASATNFNQSTESVTVIAGNVTWANITLKPSTSPGQNCSVTNTCPTKPGGGGTSGNSNLLLYAGIGAAVVVAAIVAGVLLMRRRPPAEDSGTASSQPAAYDESAEGGGTPPST
ncbi:MAG TPA: sialidase family protein [Thermoplasmata archaeon]|nr:sialidase family protein [Thermoplasmata archaeon]